MTAQVSDVRGRCRLHGISNKLDYEECQVCKKQTDSYAERKWYSNLLPHLLCAHASNSGVFPNARILHKPAIALRQCRCKCAALWSKVILFIAFFNSGTASSRRCAITVGATWASRKSITYPSTLTSLSTSPITRKTWLINSLRSSLLRHVFS